MSHRDCNYCEWKRLEAKGYSIKEQVDARVKRELNEAQLKCRHPGQRPKLYAGNQTGLIECPHCTMTWPIRCDYRAQDGSQCGLPRNHQGACES